MADFVVKQVACETTDTTQDITDSGFGTPKAAFFIVVGADVNGTEDDHCCMGVGACDGTRQWSVSGWSKDNQTTTDTGMRSRGDKCVSFDEGGGATYCHAAFDQWVTDGVRIDWTNAPGTAYKLIIKIQIS